MDTTKISYPKLRKFLAIGIYVQVLVIIPTLVIWVGLLTLFAKTIPYLHFSEEQLYFLRNHYTLIFFVSLEVALFIEMLLLAAITLMIVTKKRK